MKAVHLLVFILIDDQQAATIIIPQEKTMHPTSSSAGNYLINCSLLVV